MINSLSQSAVSNYQSGNNSKGRSELVQLYRSIKSEPASLKNINDPHTLGMAFLLMLDDRLSSDIDTQQMMASVSYYFFSKAINDAPHNYNYVKDRVLMLNMGQDAFLHTVKSPLNLYEGVSMLSSSFGNVDSKARDEIEIMEVSDLLMQPTICQLMPEMKERKKQLMAGLGINHANMEGYMEKGQTNHKKLFEYLNRQIIINEDLDF